MKFTLDWLKDHLDTTATADQVSEALTTIGLEVESVEDQGKALRPFVVALVVEAKPHPNSDHLNLCKVDAGTGAIIDVVCGAPNVRTGMKSVFAFPGTWIPGKDFELRPGVVIRGAPSNGMLCSAAELQLSEDHDGIIELPDDAPVGQSYVDYAGLGGVLIDIAITPNRGDATGIYGVARDLAAYGLGTLNPTDGYMAPVPSAGPSPIAPLPQQFAPGEPKAIRKFAGRYIAGVKNGPSPEWLQRRLRAVGLRPINALADITNFVAQGWGRPLHAYDADKVQGTMLLRNARPGEVLDGLDGRNHTLDETMCVIADDAGPLCLGGILGGERSSCTDGTVNVFMECATWNPREVVRTGRRTGIVSDARYRLERSVDPALTEPGLELATRLVLEICGGTPMEPAISGDDPLPHTVVDFPLGEVRRLTGLDLPAERITELLARLGFAVVGTGTTLQVTVPTWRPDVTQKADLVEEVMRLEGVDKVPVDPLPRLSGVAPRMLTTLQSRRRLAKRVLAARGLDEAVTWSFISAAEAVRFGGGKPELRLANAIASDLSDMRPSLLPGLLAAARRNQNRGVAAMALFEVGQVFLSDRPEGQHTYATAIRSGTPAATWDHAGSPGVFDAKADLAAVLDGLGHDLDKLQLVAEAPAWAHPGRSGRVQLGPTNVIAWFGELHPALAAEMDLTGPVVAFELDLDAIPEPRRKATRARGALKLSDLMPVERDFAFLVDRGVAAGSLLKAARGADKALISDVAVFDLFEGKGVAETQKSVAIRVTLQPTDKTLTDEKIDRVAGAIVAAVAKATGGTLRGMSAAALPVGSSYAALPGGNPARRTPRAPDRARPEAFTQAFDTKTLFYDRFRAADGRRILLVGPPPYGLDYRSAVFTARPSGNRLRPRFNASLSTMLTELGNVPAGTTGIDVDMAGERLALPVQPSSVPDLAGRRLLFTINRNNDLAWIREWAGYHARLHGTDAVIVFDNGSTRYSPAELHATLASVPGIAHVGVPSWPYSFGPFDAALAANPYWGRFLQIGTMSVLLRRYGERAYGLLDCDIDELAGTRSGTSIYDLARNSRGGLVVFRGIWVEAVGQGARHRDYTQTLADPATARSPQRKWALDPTRPWVRRLSVQPYWHWIEGRAWFSKSMPDDALYWHFKGINTNWKHDRTRAPDAALVRDELLAQRFAQLAAAE